MRPALVFVRAFALVSMFGCAERQTACAPVPPAPLAAQASSITSAAAAPQASAIAAIPLNLPRASDLAPKLALPGATQGIEMLSPLAAVDLAADGTNYFNGGRVWSPEELLAAAKQAYQADPSVQAIIRADRQASWSTVVNAMDVLKQAGITRLAFAVDASTQQQP